MIRHELLGLTLLILVAAMVTTLVWAVLVLLLSMDLGQYTNHPGLWQR